MYGLGGRSRLRFLPLAPPRYPVIPTPSHPAAPAFPLAKSSFDLHSLVDEQHDSAARPLAGSPMIDQQKHLSRRKMIVGTTSCALGTLVPGTAGAKPKKTATFVLVHGAWHGGWCWKKVRRLLVAAGHDVFTPTLTGLGERAHLLNAEISLETHVQDVAAVLEMEDLGDVILVGHSYAGMVIAGVAEKAGPRISKLVYLDAFLPEDGKALRDYGPVPKLREDGWRVPPLGPPGAFNVKEARDVEWVGSRLGDQPLKTFTRPVRLSAERSGAIPGVYIQCTKAPVFVEASERARRRGYHFAELLIAGHDAMITKPEELVRILGELT